MNENHEQRQRFVAWREIANALRRQYMSHEKRRELMIVFYNDIERERAKWPESDFENACIALKRVLTYITADGYLTHTGVKAGLRLLETICQQKIQDWFDPSHIEPANPDELPF